MNKRISDIFDYGDEIVMSGELLELDPEEIRELTMKKIHEGVKLSHSLHTLRKTGRTLLIAAVLLSLLTVTALAVGLSIHAQRQSELRDKLGIEANRVPDYVEYPVPETAEAAAPKLTLLSTISNGEFQTVYLNLSPVEPEEIMDDRLLQPDAEPDTEGLYRYTVSLNGQEDAGRLNVAVLDWDFAPEDIVQGSPEDLDLSGLSEEEAEQVRRNASWHYPRSKAILQKYLDQAYDAETRTLTMEAVFFCGDLPEGELNLGVRLWRVPWDAETGSYHLRGEMEPVRDFGAETLTKLEPDVKTVWFPEPVEFVNESTGGRGRFLGAELMSQGFRWVYEYDDAEKVLNPGDFAAEEERLAWLELSQSWLRAIDGMESEACLLFSDGSSFDWLGAVSTDYADGVCRDVVYWETATINVSEVVGIRIGGVTVPVK